AISPTHQRVGYASEAARALIEYAVRDLNVGRVLAGTTFDNIASIGVMKKLGMKMYVNGLDVPEWFQVVGMATNY
ncbi:MAG: GNAT family N-acetyltransferase, partial [bacterium]|nr:GNAT family N-acetyltransferase [Candidatus Kapabacteria bacterium]